MDTSLDEYRQYSFMKSRIPRLNALEVFVPTGTEQDDELNAVINRTGNSRWFPADGGHRVLILYEGGEYDTTRFSLIREGWDHEHCTRCRGRIEAMTLCYVTPDGPYVVLCADCHAAVFAE